MDRRNFLAIAAATPTLPLFPTSPESDIRSAVALAPESIEAACELAGNFAWLEAAAMHDSARWGETYTPEIRTTRKMTIHGFDPSIPDRLTMQAIYFCHPDPNEARRQYDSLPLHKFDSWFPAWSEDRCCWFAFFGVRDGLA